MGNMKKLGRPREYAEGTQKLTATVPKDLYRDFVGAWKALGTRNISRAVTETLRLWLGTKALSLSTTNPDLAAVFLDLKPEALARLRKLAKTRDKSASCLAAEIVSAFLDAARAG